MSPAAHRLALAAIVTVGVVLRVIWLAQNVGTPDFDSPVLDPQLNDYWARALISGDWTPPPHADDPEIRSSPYGRPPGYPWLLTGMYAMSGGRYIAPRLVQLFMGIVNILLVFWLGRRLMGSAVGLAAAALMAVYWTAIYFEGELNSPVWEVSAALGMALLLLRQRSGPSRLDLAGAGALLGFGALMRPNVLLCGAAVFLWLWGMRRFHDGGGQALVQRVLLFTLACGLVVAPVIVRNWRVSGEFVLISYYGGVNAYIGNNPASEGTSPTVPDLYAIAGMDKWNCFNYPKVIRGLGAHLEQPDLSFSGASRYFYRRALEFWRTDPIAALTLTLRKAWFFWGPHEISDSKVIQQQRDQSALLSRLPGFSSLLALSLTGLIVLLRRPRALRFNGEMALPLLYVAAYFLSVLPFFIAGRYRFPALPLLLPFSGYAIATFIDGARTGRWRSVGMGLVLWGMLLALVATPLLPWQPDMSTWHLHHGFAHAARARDTAAEEAFRQAIGARPNNDEAHLQLGYLLARHGRNEDAIAHYEAAVTANPQNLYARNNLGYTYHLLGRLDDAETQLRAAVEQQPAFTLARNNLGNVLVDRGKTDEALEQFASVLRINNADVHAQFNIGNALLAADRHTEAADAFRTALERFPHNPDIANNLGLALARDGRLEESIPWFQMALELAAPYPLAHFNLGNVYGDLGRLDKAREHFERCLEHWPDHEEARERLRFLRSIDED